MGLYEFWRRMVGAPPPGKGYMSTRRARQALENAKSAGGKHATAAHLAAALVAFSESSAALVLKKLEVDVGVLREAVKNDGATTPMQTILELADRERRVFGHLSVGTEHLLIALVVHGNNAVARHFNEKAIRLPTLRELVVKTVDPVFNPDAN